MHFAGTFWRQKPTTSSLHQEWGWCHVYLNNQGFVAIVEWVG